MAKKSLAPRQARSRESERKLLQAAFQLLAKEGLEGATIPRIATQAGLSPAAIYRRFPDKTALLEAVVLAAVESTQKLTLRTLTPLMAAQQPLPALLDSLIAPMIKGYRSQAGVLRCMRQLTQTSEHQAFRNKVVRIEKRTFEHVIEVLMLYRTQIRHPNPQLAISLALTSLICTLLELFQDYTLLGYWPAFVPQDDAALCRELTRMFLRQLGYEDA